MLITDLMRRDCEAETESRRNRQYRGRKGPDGCKKSAGNSGAGLLLSRGDQGTNQQRAGQRERPIQPGPQAFDQPDHGSSSFAACFPVATGAWTSLIPQL